MKTLFIIKKIILAILFSVFMNQIKAEINIPKIITFSRSEIFEFIKKKSSISDIYKSDEFIVYKVNKSIFLSFFKNGKVIKIDKFGKIHEFDTGFKNKYIWCKENGEVVLTKQELYGEGYNFSLDYDFKLNVSRVVFSNDYNYFAVNYVTHPLKKNPERSAPFFYIFETGNSELVYSRNTYLPNYIAHDDQTDTLYCVASEKITVIDLNYNNELSAQNSYNVREEILIDEPLEQKEGRYMKILDYDNDTESLLVAFIDPGKRFFWNSGKRFFCLNLDSKRWFEIKCNPKEFVFFKIKELSL